MKMRLIIYLLLSFAMLPSGRGQSRTLDSLVSLIKVSRPDTNRVALLLEAGKYHLLKPGNEKKDLDSAFSFFDPAIALSRSLHEDKWVNESLKWKGDCYLEGYDLVHGEACFRMVTDYYRRNGERREEGWTWWRLGDCIPELNEQFIDEKARIYRKAKSCFQDANDSEKVMDLLKKMAEEHLKENKIDLAERELLDALAGYKRIGYPNLHYTYDMLRAVYRIKGDAGQEVFYAIEMIKCMERTRDFWMAPVFYANAAQTYCVARMYDQSLVACRKAISYVNERNDYFSYYRIMAVAVRYAIRDLLYKDSASAALDFLKAMTRLYPPVLVWQREEALWGFGLCYSALGDYGRAEREYTRLSSLVDSFSKSPAGFESFLSPEIIYMDYLSISHLYVLMHQYAKADLYLHKIPEFPSYPVGVTQRVEFELVRSQIDSGLGNYRSALQHFGFHKTLSDSLYAVDKNKQVQELQIKYETEKKDKDLRLQADNIQLLTKQNQLQTIQSEKSTILRNMMIGGLALMLLLVGIVYSRYRMKRRNILQLEHQKGEILEKNRSLEKLLHENEWLLREVHHRVKNNLQVVMSLLSSQSAYLHDEAAFNAVMNSRHRIQAMSLIHQKLYKSEDVSSIDMREYIGDLVDYLKDSFETVGRVGVELRIDAVFLDVLQAVPVGLILNEVITNAFKHAFPFSREDRISIRLERKGKDELLLFIADNGRGIGLDTHTREHQSFGMLLIQGLVEDLDGQLEVKGGAGTVYIIRFRQVYPGPKSVSMG
jgi:two-component sensor histidine kinase/tetratricopeptide (TPR) repeat protein